MKAWVVSDLHGVPLEPPSGADIAIIAGDVCNDEWLIETAGKLPVVFVAGNHEFYDEEYHERVRSLYSLKSCNFYFLDNDDVGIFDTDIAGATLWTDYGNNPVAAEAARRGMNDHKYIKWSKKPYQRFLPSHATRLHRESLEYLKQCDADIIVTHHAPHRGSIHPRYEGQLINHAYFSDALEQFDNPPRLWIHGHVHKSFDYMVGDTRVICNPMGRGNENPRFDKELIIELG